MRKDAGVCTNHKKHDFLMCRRVSFRRISRFLPIGRFINGKKPIFYARRSQTETTRYGRFHEKNENS